MLLFIIILTFVAISMGVAWYLIAHDHGEREPIGALWLAAGCGFGGAVAAAIIESILIPSRDLALGRPLGSLLVTCLGVGVIEETCKFVPLALLIYRKRYFNEHTDGIIYFALAGLGFGLPENILYSLQFGAKVGLGRIILTPFFHAATTAFVGFFLIRYKLRSGSKWVVAGALVSAMLLHAIYDFGLTSGNSYYALLSIIITLGLSIGLFLFFVRATDLDQERGLSVVGHNSFCRTCGFPNPKHMLYCTHCGGHA